MSRRLVVSPELEKYEQSILESVDIDRARREYAARPLTEKWGFILPQDAARLALIAAGAGMRDPFMSYPLHVEIPGGLAYVTVTAHTMSATARVVCGDDLTNDYPVYREVFTANYVVGYRIGLFLLAEEEKETREKAIAQIRGLDAWASLAMCVATLQNGMKGHGIADPRDFLAILEKETARTV